MKKNSPESLKKFEAAALYKQFDPQLRGHLTRSVSCVSACLSAVS